MHDAPALPENSLPPAEPTVVELRQYALHPQQRDVLIELFEREFVESQEAVGMSVIGQFTDRDDPDKFVWLRGFADMDARRQGLESFYGGPVWEAHRDAANATMIDSDNVLLLRPARTGAVFSPATEERPPVGAEVRDQGIVSAAIVHLRSREVGEEAVDVFESMIAPVIPVAGGLLLGYFLSENSANNFPRLPVRENEPVLIWFAGFAYEHDSIAVVRAASALSEARLSRGIEHLSLAPTARSLLTAEGPACAATEALSKCSAGSVGARTRSE
jgi:hypothetical protein